MSFTQFKTYEQTSHLKKSKRIIQPLTWNIRDTAQVRKILTFDQSNSEIGTSGSFDEIEKEETKQINIPRPENAMMEKYCNYWANDKSHQTFDSLKDFKIQKAFTQENVFTRLATNMHHNKQQALRPFQNHEKFHRGLIISPQPIKQDFLQTGNQTSKLKQRREIKTQFSQNTFNSSKFKKNIEINRLPSDLNIRYSQLKTKHQKSESLLPELVQAIETYQNNSVKSKQCIKLQNLYQNNKSKLKSQIMNKKPNLILNIYNSKQMDPIFKHGIVTQRSKKQQKFQLQNQNRRKLQKPLDKNRKQEIQISEFYQPKKIKTKVQ